METVSCAQNLGVTMLKITNLTVRDIRFPTSRLLDGSDAINPDPDYSAAYVVLETNNGDGPEGHGLTFTIGRGTEICVAAALAYAPLIIGRDLDNIRNDLGSFWHSLASDSQTRWIGPEKGAVHLALAAIVNAVWDLIAKVDEKPVWRLLADMSPEEIVKAVDFTYIDDVMTPAAALDLLKDKQAGKAERIAIFEREGYPAYTTSAGWLGYSDEKMRRLCNHFTREEGFKHLKFKVGGSLEDDKRRLAAMREECGDAITLSIDANQIWGVNQAIEWVRELAPYQPYWIEEPTSPDDILGHRAIGDALRPLGIKIATGEHCHNRVMFKQFLQADAMDICQIDSCRLGGLNEVIAVLLLAAQHEVPVCPHAGGVGLCEYVQHISSFDYIAVSGSTEGRAIEYADHLHEHFVDPVRVKGGAYLAPSKPGYSVEMLPESLNTYEFPNGPEWKDAQ